MIIILLIINKNNNNSNIIIERKIRFIGTRKTYSTTK